MKTNFFIGRYKKRRMSLVLILILAIASGSLTLAAMLQPSVNPPEQLVAIDPTTEPAAQPLSRIDISTAMERLNDKSRPFTLVVLGDSTGADESAWPAQVSEWISSQFDRPVTFHSWSEGLEPPGYKTPARSIGSGANAAVTVYNASAPSRNATYSLKELGRMIPVEMGSVDMIFVNHGHNHGPDLLVPEVHALASKLAEEAPAAALILVLQNPEIEGTPHAVVQSTNTEGLKLYAERFGYASIDARRAYADYGDFENLYQDNVHPAGAEGYRIWAEEIIASLSGENK